MVIIDNLLDAMWDNSDLDVSRIEYKLNDYMERKDYEEMLWFLYNLKKEIKNELLVDYIDRFIDNLDEVIE